MRRKVRESGTGRDVNKEEEEDFGKNKKAKTHSHGDHEKVPAAVADREVGGGALERCTWVQKDLDIKYHDEEWGEPSRDDQHLFEMLVLEGFQGLLPSFFFVLFCFVLFGSLSNSALDLARQVGSFM